METVIRPLGIAFLLFLPAFSGCASMGSLEDIIGDAAGGLYGDELRGEIRYVDTRRQEIELSSGWGRSERVRFDRRTEVIYRQRRYDVRSLDRGDRVRIRLSDTRSREPYARVIEVERSTYDDASSRRIQRIAGRVTDVDTRSGWFELEDAGRMRYLVVLPRDPSRSLVDRFRRLRRGNRVEFDAERLSRDRFEIRRFR